jgi:hypothetical protein
MRFGAECEAITHVHDISAHKMYNAGVSGVIWIYRRPNPFLKFE